VQGKPDSNGALRTVVGDSTRPAAPHPFAGGVAGKAILGTDEVLLGSQVVIENAALGCSGEVLSADNAQGRRGGQVALQSHPPVPKRGWREAAMDDTGRSSRDGMPRWDECRNVDTLVTESLDRLHLCGRSMSAPKDEL